MDQWAGSTWVRWVVVLVSVSALSAQAQAQAQDRPGIALPRAVEDARRWEDVEREGLFKLKYLEVGESVYVSMGGDLRLRVEGIDNRGFVEGAPGVNWFERGMVHGEVGGAKWRAFGQVLSGWAQGAPPIRGVDADAVVLHQAFGELRDLEVGSWRLQVRAGRMELGEGRMFSLREGRNVRLSHDGVWSVARRGAVALKAMYLQPVEVEDGVLDNRSRWSNHLIRGQVSWDLWRDEGDLVRLEGSYQEGYRLTQRYYRGTGEERRRTVALRGVVQKTLALGRWSLDTEIFGQGGRFGELPIWASRVALETGWVVSEWPLKPELSVQLDYSSGDAGDEAEYLGTFQAYYPRGSYFSEFSLVAPSNLIAISPAVGGMLGPVRLRLDYGRFFRSSDQEGMYSPGMVPILGRAEGGGRYLGELVGLSTSWQIRREVSVHGGAVVFWPGSYGRSLGQEAVVSYGTAWLRMAF